MNHPLHLERYIAMRPERWFQKLTAIDEFKLPAQAFARPMIAPGQEPVAGLLDASVVLRSMDEDDDDETDIWGDPLPKMEMAGDTAVIPIKGMIATGYPSIYKRFGIVDLEDVAANVETAMADPNCKSLVLDVDSPGGTLGRLPEFASMVATLASTGPKKIGARVGQLCCSAAYYAVAGCNVISASTSSELVNIGVYQVNYDCTKAFEMFGYKVQVFKSGKYKAAGVPGTSLSDDQEAEIQASIEDLGAMFRAHVKACRPSADESNMQGQTFFGPKAVALGFADDDAPTMKEFLARFKAHANS